MRILLAVLLVAAVNATDFMVGLLKGIGESGNSTDLNKCVKNLTKPLHDIHAALEIMKKVSAQTLAKGLPMLFRAINHIFVTIKACTEGFETLQKLISAMVHPDIRKIVSKIVANPKQFQHDVTSALTAFNSGKYSAAGKAVGDMLKLVFLSSSEMLGSDATDFLKGFVEGIGETGDVEKLAKCLKDLQSIFEKIKSALSVLKHINLENLVKGLTTLFEAINSLFTMLKPCADGFEKINKLIKALAKPKIRKIAMEIAMHPTQFLQDVNSAVTCFNNKDYHCSGKSIGDMFKIMFF